MGRVVWCAWASIIRGWTPAGKSSLTYCDHVDAYGNSNDLFTARVAPRAPLSPSRGARARVCPPASCCPPGEHPALEHRGRPAPWRPSPATPARQRLAQPCRQPAGRRPARRARIEPMVGDGQPARLGRLGGGDCKRLGGRAANTMKTAMQKLLQPRFKGVWYAATNFAPIRLSDTSQGQCPWHHRRSDDSPGRHAPEGCAARLRRTARASPA